MNTQTETYGIFESREPKPPLTIKWPNRASKSIQDRLHRAVHSGRIQKIRYIISAGCPVDAFNKEGQTPLFCAAFIGKSDVVDLLLSFGAKPNGRCDPGGFTPVHAACYSGCALTLKLILQAGGDLRLSDHKMLRPPDWSLLQSDGEKIRTIREIIEGARLCVMQSSGIDMLKELNMTLALRSEGAVRSLIKDMLRKTMLFGGRHDINVQMDILTNSILSTGFGKVYYGNGMKCANVTGIPYISELDELELDRKKDTPSWVSGRFTDYVPYIWTKRQCNVTLRKVKKQAGFGACTDILLSELEIYGKLNHPNILFLMGVCQSDNFDSLSLVYERISIGSLYFVLYQERKSISVRLQHDIIISITEALEYLHSLNIIHCGLSSHSVMLLNGGQAKLGCFENAIQGNDKDLISIMDRHPILSSEAHLKVLRHWLAPEVILHKKYSKRSDIYSLCSIIWELCYGEIPWKNHSLEALTKLFQIGKTHLELDENLIPECWYHLLSLGLDVKPNSGSDSDLDLTEIREMMHISKNRIKRGKETKDFSILSPFIYNKKDLSTPIYKKKDVSTLTDKKKDLSTPIYYKKDVSYPILNKKDASTLTDNNLGREYITVSKIVSQNYVHQNQKDEQESDFDQIELDTEDEAIHLAEERYQRKETLDEVDKKVYKLNLNSKEENEEEEPIDISSSSYSSESAESGISAKSSSSSKSKSSTASKLKSKLGTIFSLGMRLSRLEAKLSPFGRPKRREKTVIKPASHLMQRQISASDVQVPKPNFFMNFTTENLSKRLFGGSNSELQVQQQGQGQGQIQQIKPASHSTSFHPNESFKSLKGQQQQQDYLENTFDVERPYSAGANFGEIPDTYPPPGYVNSKVEKYNTFPIKKRGTAGTGMGFRRGSSYSRLPLELKLAIIKPLRLFMQPSEFPRRPWITTPSPPPPPLSQSNFLSSTLKTSPPSLREENGNNNSNSKGLFSPLFLHQIPPLESLKTRTLGFGFGGEKKRIGVSVGTQWSDNEECDSEFNGEEDEIENQDNDNEEEDKIEDNNNEDDGEIEIEDLNDEEDEEIKNISDLNDDDKTLLADKSDGDGNVGKIRISEIIEEEEENEMLVGEGDQDVHVDDNIEKIAELNEDKEKGTGEGDQAKVELSKSK